MVSRLWVLLEQFTLISKEGLLQLLFRSMGECSECKEKIFKGHRAPYPIISLFHLACINVWVSKKNFGKLRKDQNDFTCGNCKIRTRYVVLAQTAQSHISSTPKCKVAEALAPDYAEAIRLAVMDAQKVAVVQEYDSFLNFLKGFERKHLEWISDIKASINERKTNISKNDEQIGTLKINSTV